MLALNIALRYLLARKSHSAINAITLVAACGVAIITAALICVLSVYNGFESIVGELTSQLDPHLRIEPRNGKFFSDDDSLRLLIGSNPDVEGLSAMLQETVLISNGNRQIPAQMRGVDSMYRHVTSIDSIIWDGEYILRDPVVDYAIIGVGLSSLVSCRPGYLRPMTFFCPRREGRIDLLNPEDAFVQHDFFCSASFAVQQSDYDDKLCIISIDAARQLLSDSTLCSSYELRLRQGADADGVKKALLAAMTPQQADSYDILTRYEQQADSYRIVLIEKWITFAIIIFILLIASFNIIGALSMLIIDKEEEIRTLRHLGASSGLIRQIFTAEGWLISGSGSVAGIIIGVVLCLIQQHYGIIGLGDGTGTFVVDSYPVVLQLSDVICSAIAVLLIGWAATAITTHSQTRNHIF